MVLRAQPSELVAAAFIFLQVLFTTHASMLMLLNSLVQRLVLPIVDYKPHVREREVIHTSVASALALQDVSA